MERIDILETEFDVKAEGGKYILNNDTAYIENKTFGMYSTTYKFNNIPSSHPLAIISSSDFISYTGNTKIYVKTIGFTSPYYQFYESATSSTPITNNDINLVPGRTYTFIAAENLSSKNHPFELFNVSGVFQLTTEGS